MRLLDKYESINNELFLLTSNKVHNENLSLDSQNRLNGILEVELPYLKTEFFLLSEDLDADNEVAGKPSEVKETTNKLIELGSKLNNLLVLKDDYTDLAALELATKINEEDISILHDNLNTDLLLLKIKYGNLLENYQNEFAQDLKSLSNIILITGILGILFGITLAILVISSISKPIQAINKGALMVSNGDYEVGIHLKGKDEPASLGASFNNDLFFKE